MQPDDPPIFLEIDQIEDGREHVGGLGEDFIFQARRIGNPSVEGRHSTHGPVQPGEEVIRDAGEAIRKALNKAEPATHYGIGQGIVQKVASNRRILGPDGKVQYIRYSATRSPKIRAFPAGTIDPELKMLSFWNGDRCLAAVTWYATHPQSYYRTGMPTPDFPGLARNARQAATGIPHIHFYGAGGNVVAGKWNDGSRKNRKILTGRVAAGKTTLADEKAKGSARFFAAIKLDWLQRSERKEPIQLSCLKVGRARVLHMPGELFVEYQLNAQKLRPNLFVAMAAYGDYSAGYIGTEIAYAEGGYETSPGRPKTSPKVSQRRTPCSSANSTSQRMS